MQVLYVITVTAPGLFLLFDGNQSSWDLEAAVVFNTVYDENLLYIRTLVHKEAPSVCHKSPKIKQWYQQPERNPSLTQSLTSTAFMLTKCC